LIKTFRHKGLKELFETGRSRKVSSALADKCLNRLDMLDASLVPEDMHIPGFRFHGLQGNPKRYSVRVSGNYRITFGWNGEDAVLVDLEDYR
jgi:proteic killer suppression protein